MPEKFKQDFPSTIVMLDGTELKLEKPSWLSQVHSDYTSCTLKGLVGIHPCGSFIFISTSFSGAISDKEITVQRGLLDVLPKSYYTARS